MSFKKITAIIRSTKLEEVEESLRKLRVSGVTVFPVKGYGEAANVLARDWMTRDFCLELYTSDDRLEEIVRAILDAASTGLSGDGIIAISNVERLYRIREKALAKESAA